MQVTKAAARQDELLPQPLTAHLGGLERVVPAQQLELARAPLVVEFRRELEECPLARARS